MVHAVHPTSPIVTPPSTEPAKPRPGVDASGAPLPDQDVWGVKIGRANRSLDTSNGIDGWERKALLEVAKKSPREFLQKLLADSANGTPVDYKFVKELDIGVVKVDFHAAEGSVRTTASLDVFQKSSDRWLKPYMAKDARDKGARAKITLEVTGKIQESGGLEDVQIEARATNVPKFSAKKIVKLHTLEKDLKKAISSEGSQKEKSDKVIGIVQDAIETLSDFPLPFIMKLIGDHDVLKAEIRGDKRDGRAKVELGDGKYSVTLRDFIGDKKKGEPDVRARIAGKSGEDKDTISVDELRVFSNDKISVEWSDEGQPKLSRVGKNGEKTALNDHIGEVMVYLPMALALAGDKGIF
jgi:hypothetical protein